ncbi:hypothetical protein A9Q81_08255 [Gammaproteobacteria bacterium 42_54_T18]|mgnify:CR=1 FL=1|nr:hypothetical protein A9Q81_08255 [Gammaproteobacteria bacterium 42_54_T18]
MSKFPVFIACIAIFLGGCATNSNLSTLSIDALDGVKINFPVERIDAINGSDIEFYSENKTIGLFKRVSVPKERQPAVNAVKSGYELAKKGDQPPYELSLKKGLYGFAVDYKGMTTIHLASESEPEFMATMSVPTADVATLISGLQ